MKMKSRKVLTLLLTFVFVLTATSSVFAQWPSFQRGDNNNGVITDAPDITAPIDVSSVSLPYNGSIFTGVDTTAVIDEDTAYVLYNSGDYDPSNTSGGARIAAVDLTAPSSAPNWTYSLDARAGDTQQLSTMYLDTAEDELYAAATYYTNELNGTTLAGWTDINGNQLTAPVTFMPGVPKTIYYKGLSLPSDFRQSQLATDINFEATEDTNTTGTITLTPRNGDPAINLGTSSYFGGDWTLFNIEDVLVPAGQYDIAVTIEVDPNETSTVAVSSLSFLTSRWSLYKLNGFDVETEPTAKTMLATGYGQANTPIYRDEGNSNIYFGIYEGDRSYYQYDIVNNQLLAFKPNGGDDFYWAGAVAMELNEDPYVAFGGDKGIIYARPVGAAFGSAGDVSVNLASIEPNVGSVRSTLSLHNDGYAYFKQCCLRGQFCRC